MSTGLLPPALHTAWPAPPTPPRLCWESCTLLRGGDLTTILAKEGPLSWESMGLWGVECEVGVVQLPVELFISEVNLHSINELGANGPGISGASFFERVVQTLSYLDVCAEKNWVLWTESKVISLGHVGWERLLRTLARKVDGKAPCQRQTGGFCCSYPWGVVLPVSVERLLSCIRSVFQEFQTL